MTHILIPIEALEEGKLSRSDVNYIYNSFPKVNLSEEYVETKMLFEFGGDDYPAGYNEGYRQAIKNLLTTNK